MIILGLWDSNDSGACIIEDGKIKVAINEERLTRRKLEVLFPENSILFCLKYMNLKPNDIEHVAYSTSDFTVSLTRLLPGIKNKYYYVRRRKTDKPMFDNMDLTIFNTAGAFGSNFVFKSLSDKIIRKNLAKIGFNHKYKTHLVEHHHGHAATAYFCSGMKEAICITLDGLGDGISSTVNVCEGSKIKRISSSKTRDSIGAFFHEITHLLNMRVLEDEGKAMALADFAYPVEDKNNPMMNFFKVDGLKIKAVISPEKRFNMMKKILWKTPREQFCYMAQMVLNKNVDELIKNAMEKTNIKNLCWAGGIASNIKMNMSIKLLDGVKDWFVFPHMGDGGLAVGAAIAVSSELEGTKPYKLENVFFGPEYNEDEIKKELLNYKEKLTFEKGIDVGDTISSLISKGNVVFNFQDRMEYGPRALGNRSILAPAGDVEIKDKINMLIKKRVWFQPFCPSVLEKDSLKLFENVDKYDKFMTMSYMSKPEIKKYIGAVINVDNSSRPQMVGSENPKFQSILNGVKRKTGYGIVLNTSLNIHGDPLVCSPKDAIETLIRSGNKHMVLGNYLVTKVK